MKSINISKKKLDSLEPLILPKTVLSTECELFHYEYQHQAKVLKKLFTYDGLTFANKLYTIEALNTYLNFMPDNFIIPELLVSISKRVEAFIMPYVEGINLSVLLNDNSIDPEEQKYYLKIIGQILEQMKNIRKNPSLTDFYLSDLHEANFIVNLEKKQLYVGDLDSCKIAGNRAFPARYLSPFALLNNAKEKYKINEDKHFESEGHVIADENSDLYCYCIVLLNYLYGKKVNNLELDEFYNYLNYLDALKIDLNLLKCFEKLVSYEKNENPMNYIDTLSSKQIYRAREIVYRANR